MWTLKLFAVFFLVFEEARSFSFTSRKTFSSTKSHAGFGNIEQQLSGKPKFDGKPTIERHMAAFRKLGASKSNSVDCYVRRDDSEKYFYVGKSTGGQVCDGITSAGLQKRIILEHAKLLQSELKRAKTLQVENISK